MMMKVLALLLVSCLSAQAQLRTQWCEGGHDHHEDSLHELPHPEDFLKIIFDLYGDNATCTITHEGYHDLLHDLGIGGEHEHHSEADSFDHHTCFNGHDLLKIHNISEDGDLTEAGFIELSPTFLEQVLHGCAHSHGEEEPEEPPTDGEVWGYSIAAVLIISSFSLLGVPMARFSVKPFYKYIILFMLSLAFGTLAGDAIMHLIPHGLGLHNHGDEGHDHDTHSDEHDHGSSIDSSVWKSFLTSMVILGFFNLQLLFSYFKPQTQGSDTEKARTRTNVIEPELGDSKKMDENGSVNIVSSQVELVPEEQAHKAPESMAWMVVIGDSLHNFTDGLAIAAAFSESWELGLSTSIAIFCHEIPHEFGDVAAMLSTGWSWKRVILMQMITQSFAVLGMLIGIPIAESSSESSMWILMIAAGMFLYVAMCEIVPELVRCFRIYNPTHSVLLINGGVLLGYALMLMISVLEHTYGDHSH